MQPLAMDLNIAETSDRKSRKRNDSYFDAVFKNMPDLPQIAKSDGLPPAPSNTPATTQNKLEPILSAPAVATVAPSGPIQKIGDLYTGDPFFEAISERRHHFILETPIEEPFPAEMESVIFGTGCFWGAEKAFWRLPGVYSTAVGFARGTTKNPSYPAVCTGWTGHNEVVRVVYNPSKIAFADLLRMFWQCHDPTQGNGQGNDRGSQYRSGIYCTTESQKALAESSRTAYEAELMRKGRGKGKKITTEITGPESPTTMYLADEYHQQYLAKPGSRPYCSAMPTGVNLPEYSEWVPDSIQQNMAHEPKLSKKFWSKHGPKPGCVLRQPNKPIKWSK